MLFDGSGLVFCMDIDIWGVHETVCRGWRLSKTGGRFQQQVLLHFLESGGWFFGVWFGAVLGGDTLHANPIETISHLALGISLKLNVIHVARIKQLYLRVVNFHITGEIPFSCILDHVFVLERWSKT